MKYTIPAFDPTDAGTIAATTVTIARANVMRALRLTGANKVYVHTVKPTTSQQHLDGFPLGPNAADAELGECFPLEARGGAGRDFYITAVSASEVRTLDIQ